MRNLRATDLTRGWMRRNFFQAMSGKMRSKTQFDGAMQLSVFLSVDSVTKEGYLQKEIRQALDVANEKPEGSIFLIPARLDNCSD